jgi:hypothetical protein
VPGLSSPRTLRPRQKAKRTNASAAPGRSSEPLVDAGKTWGELTPPALEKAIVGSKPKSDFERSKRTIFHETPLPLRLSS